MKEIPFRTSIAEITDIEVTHDLQRTEANTIDGNFQVHGSYKMTDTSTKEEQFSYELPFTIEVDEKYDLENVKIKISDFYFEIMNEDTLKVNIEVELSEVELREQEEILEEVRKDVIEEAIVEEQEEIKQEEREEKIEEVEEPIASERCYEEEQETETKKEVEPIDILNEELQKLDQEPLQSPKKEPSISDIFTNVSNDEDAFKTYHVHIVRENDTLDDILTNYHLTKEEASEYNDLNNVKIGSKLILPCAKDE